VVEFTLRGHEVTWWRRDASTFPDGGRIRYDGILGEGTTRPAAVTDDLAAALADAALVLCPLPATAQPALLEGLRPHLVPGQAVAFTPGTLGTWLGACLRPDVVFLETGTLPYLTRCPAPGHVSIPVVALFLVLSRYLISGLTLGAVKG
jgi:opine dehydrogenase